MYHETLPKNENSSFKNIIYWSTNLFPVTILMPDSTTGKKPFEGIGLNANIITQQILNITSSYSRNSGPPNSNLRSPTPFPFNSDIAISGKSGKPLPLPILFQIKRPTIPIRLFTSWGLTCSTLSFHKLLNIRSWVSFVSDAWFSRVYINGSAQFLCLCICAVLEGSRENITGTLMFALLPVSKIFQGIFLSRNAKSS